MASVERRKSKRLFDALAPAHNGDGDPDKTSSPSTERRKSKRLSQTLPSPHNADGDAASAADTPVSKKSALADEPVDQKSAAVADEPAASDKSALSSKKANRNGDAAPVEEKLVGKKLAVADEPVADEPASKGSDSSSKMTNRQEASGEKPSKRRKKTEDESSYRFIGESIPAEEAKERWPERYGRKVSFGVVLAGFGQLDPNSVSAPAGMKIVDV
ncbi:hypothetical protein ACLOJK_006613 [Asimina triloba]